MFTNLFEERNVKQKVEYIYIYNERIELWCNECTKSLL